MDLKIFQELCDGDADALRDLINIYLLNTDEQMQGLATAIHDANHTEVSRQAHALVGANLMVGISAPVPLLRAIEQCGDQRDSDKAAGLLKDLSSQFEIIFAELRALLR